MIAQAEKLLATTKKRLAEYEEKILTGNCGGNGTIEGEVAAYRAAVTFRRECIRVIADIEKIFGDKNQEEDD